MKRHSPSSVDKLPPPIRETVGRLLAANVTLDDIVAKLRELEATSDVDFTAPSRSAIGRYAERLRAAQVKMSQGRAIAEALAPKFGEAPDNQVGRLASELLQTVVFDLLTAVEVDDETGQAKPVEIDPKTAGVLAGVLRDVAAAQKTDADRIVKVRQEVAKEAAKAVKAIATDGGISADVAQKLWDAVMGVGAAK